MIGAKTISAEKQDDPECYRLQHELLMIQEYWPSHADAWFKALHGPGNDGEGIESVGNDSSVSN